MEYQRVCSVKETHSLGTLSSVVNLDCVVVQVELRKEGKDNAGIKRHSRWPFKGTKLVLLLRDVDSPETFSLFMNVHQRLVPSGLVPGAHLKIGKVWSIILYLLYFVLLCMYMQWNS